MTSLQTLPKQNAFVTSPYSYLNQLNVVFKISERCNLACDYCYFFFAGDESWKQHPTTMKLPTLEAAARFFQRIAVEYGLKKIIFVLHGGEPLLVKKLHFRKMCETLRAYETKNFYFRIAIQTNAVLIDEEWIEIFSEYGIEIGISLDGNKAINDLHRLDKKGRSSYNDTVRGLRMMQVAAQAGKVIPPGIICVVQPEAKGAETYRHFVYDLGVERISFRTQDLAHTPDLNKTTVKAINRFMLDVFQAWAQDNNAHIKIRQFSEPMRFMLSDSYAERAFMYQEDFRNIVSITSSGEIGPDDTLKTLAPRYREMGLHVSENQPEELLHSSVWEELRIAAHKAPEECASCKWWRMCKGGRLTTRYATENDSLNNSSVYCEGLKSLYTAIESSLLRSGIQKEDINRRLRITT